REEYVVIRGIYAIHGRTHDAENVEVEAQHNYNRDSREAVYRFFGKHFLNDTNPSNFQEKPFTPEKREDLLCLNGRKLPENAKTYDELFRYWRESAARQSEQTRDLAVLRRRLSFSLAAEIPTRILTEGSEENIVLGRAERRDRVPAWWRAGKGLPLLLVSPEGSAAARKDPAAQAALAAGRPVMLIDAFQTGATKAIRDRSPRYFLTFNKG